MMVMRLECDCGCGQPVTATWEHDDGTPMLTNERCAPGRLPLLPGQTPAQYHAAEEAHAMKAIDYADQYGWED